MQKSFRLKIIEKVFEEFSDNEAAKRDLFKLLDPEPGKFTVKHNDAKTNNHLNVDLKDPAEIKEYVELK